MTRLADLAKLIRSKNAGPFWITFDIMFESDGEFERVAQSGKITKKWISKTYNVKESDVILVNHPAARAIKFSYPRNRPQGDLGDSDLYSGQQYAPLMDLQIE